VLIIGRVGHAAVGSQWWQAFSLEQNSPDRGGGGVIPLCCAVWDAVHTCSGQVYVTVYMLCCAVLCRALSDKDRKWVAAIAAKLGDIMKQQ